LPWHRLHGWTRATDRPRFPATNHACEETDMIKGIKFASIPVRDQDRALAFWRDQVGLAVATDQPMGKQRWIELRIPGADTRLVLFTPDGHENRIGTDQNVVFWTDDVEKTWKELSAKGVTFTAPPKKEPWGTYTTFHDPDGNRFVLGTK
jgi:predicted enzyme related to lactoylglutathione lyase